MTEDMHATCRTEKVDFEDMQVRNLSPHTIDCYVRQVALFARYFNRSPELLGPDQIRAYQLHLVHERKLGWAS